MSRRHFFGQSLTLAGAFFFQQKLASAQHEKLNSQLWVLTDEEFKKAIKSKSLIYNESALGPSKDVQKVISQFPDVVSHYHALSASRNQLRENIARVESISPKYVTLWPGSRQFLRQISTMLSLRGYHCIHNWPDYQKPAERVAEIERPLTKIKQTADFRVDLDQALMEMKKHKKSYFYFSNPNLPFGRFYFLKKIEEFMSQVPANSFVILDECYIEFFGDDYRAQSGVNLLKKYPNLFVTRTFSKAYGLAALRAGYTMGDPSSLGKLIGDQENEEVSLSVFSAICASVALGDSKHVSENRKVSNELKKEIFEFAKRFSLKTVGDYGNFLGLVFDKDQLELKKLKKDAPRFNSNEHNNQYYIRLSCRNREQIVSFLGLIEKNLKKL